MVKKIKRVGADIVVYEQREENIVLARKERIKDIVNIKFKVLGANRFFNKFYKETGLEIVLENIHTDEKIVVSTYSPYLYQYFMYKYDRIPFMGIFMNVTSKNNKEYFKFQEVKSL